jgi:hypothetical protein
MAVPLIPVVVLGARIVARFAASKAGKEAAKKFAKEFGGRVTEKAKNLKSVQRAPTGSQATRMAKQKLKKDGIKPTQKDRLGPASSPKKTPKKDVRGDKIQKGIAVVGLTAASFAPGTGPKKSKRRITSEERAALSDLGDYSPRGNRAKDSAVSPKPKPKPKPKKEDGAKTPDTKKIPNFNVGVSKGGVSFGTAFRHFRKKGAKTFTWNGKKYHTKTKEEMKREK